jgi:propionyl-CoA carboxylase alpha chain
VRVDTGIEEGSEVSMYYDPMIAKLVTYGKDRNEALAHMGEALDAYYIRGVSHNISFLNALIAHPRFVSGNITTNFIAEEYPDGFHATDVPQDDPALAIVIAGAINTRLMDRAAELSGQVPSHERQVPRDWVAVINRTETPLTVRTIAGGYDIAVNDYVYHVLTNWQPGQPLVYATINEQRLTFQQDKQGAGISLFRRGARIDVTICTPRAAELNRHMLEKIPPDLSKFLLSPMPGLLVKLVVQEGEEVKAGEELAVVEAMKMENSLRAETDVVIKKVMADQGDSLVVDQPILEFE